METLTSADINLDLVQRQLDKILDSSEFAGTTRSKRLLSYLVEQSTTGQSQTLKGYTIGVDVFDRAEGFDPALDPIVRVQAGHLRKRMDRYYAEEGKDDEIRILIPKGSYAPIYEITQRPDKTDSTNSEITSEHNQPKPGKRDQKHSIAVMPFDNLSDNKDQDYFADGMTEEILNALARFKELKVISRHSTFRYKGNPGDPRDIGRELDVRYVLEGSVRLWQNQIKVSAQLIETESGSYLTNEAFVRDLSVENIFDIQEDIASRIAAEIAEPHGVIHKNGFVRRAQTNDLDAYDCRLLASEYWREPSRENHSRVRNLLERSVSLDPSYSGAWACLSLIYCDEVRGGYNTIAEPPPLDRALNAAKRAIEIEPSNAVGYHALFITHFHRAELSSFERAADKALILNSNYPDLLADLAACKGILGDWSTGYTLLLRAFDLSPHPPGWYQAIEALYHYLHKRYEEARSATEGIHLGSFYWGYLFRIMIHGQLGDAAQAKTSIDKLHTEIPQFKQTARALIQNWNIQPDDAEHMIEGWKKAGLEVDD